MSEDLRKIIVDGEEIEVPNSYTLLQAAEHAGREIPRFCYHERLSVAGNCRMCLVELVGAPKPAASCAMQVKDMRGGPNGEPPAMNTLSPMVKKAREGVMEFLLINHPLDCPICDQGGECDLQDQSLVYGRTGSRFPENKRAVEDKYMGPVIKTIMTRCIQCTRCVRFVTEVAGVPEIGMIGRGEDAEITTYLESAVTSELSGNVIDLCPVGALTSKPYAFNARPWELKKTETIDVMDAVGSNIRLDNRGAAVLRILPRVHEGVNEEWISDKTRFAWEGLSKQRLDKPYLRENGKLRPASWSEALDVASKRLSGDASKIGMIAGDLCSAEEMKAAKDLADALGIASIDCRQDGMKIGTGNATTTRQEYLFNATIAGIEDADAILIVGANPRTEAAVLNARIRKTWLNNDAKIGLIGEAVDLTYPYEHVGTSAADLAGFKKKRSGFIKTLKDAKRPLILLGAGALSRADGAQVLRAAGDLAAAVGAVSEEWNGFSVLHTAASRVAGLDLGFVPGEGGKDVAGMLDGSMDTVVLLGADEIDMSKLGDAFVIYVGSHGDNGAHRADLILPGAAWAEQDGIYANTEGRVQLAYRSVFPKGEAKENWAIFRALSERLGKTLPYDNLTQLRLKLFEDVPVLGGIDHAPGAAGAADFDVKAIGADGDVEATDFVPAIRNFYFTNPIARASKTLAECSALALAPATLAAE